MKTIKERAKEYAFEYLIGMIPFADVESCYIAGATEQRAIDDDLLREAKKMVIDKAVAWVDHNIGTITAIALRKALEE